MSAPLRSSEVDEVGRKCRKVTEAIKEARPRAQFIELDDIPQKANTLAQHLLTLGAVEVVEKS